MRILFCVLLTGVMSVQLTAQGKADRPLEVVADFDIGRYMGTWYEIARLPNSFQNACIGDVTATYTLLDDGRIEVVNRCRKKDGGISYAKGRARRASDTGPSTKLKVRFAPAFLSFLPFVWGNYWIIDLAPDYSYAVVGEPERKYFWILSRTPTMDEEVFQSLVIRATNQGYDLTTLVRTQHSL